MDLIAKLILRKKSLKSGIFVPMQSGYLDTVARMLKGINDKKQIKAAGNPIIIKEPKTEEIVNLKMQGVD